MKILITKASDDFYYEVREIEPQEIFKIIDEFKKKIIINKVKRRKIVFDQFWNEIQIGFIDYQVTIYDDYLE